MDTDQIIAIASMVIGFSSALITIYVKVNVRLAELNKDMLSMKRDMDEHKVTNRSDIKEIKEIISRDKLDNKENYLIIIESLSKLKDAMTDLKVQMANNK